MRDEVGIDIKYDKKSIKNYKRVKPNQFVIHLRSFQGGFAWSNIEGITSPAYTILDYKDPEKQVSKFWKEVLTSPTFIKRLETVTYGIRDGRSISFKDFSTLKFKVPSVEEQTQIGTFIKGIDNTIALHQRKLDALKQLKQGYLENMFPQKGESVPKLRFANFNRDWEQRKFSSLVNRVSKQSTDKNLPKVEFADIISGEGRLNKDVSLKIDERKGIVFEPGFILYGKLRPYLNNWLFPNFRGIALGDFWVFESKEAHPTFNYYVIQTRRYQKAANLSTGTKMPRSDWNTVSKTMFRVPLINEQTKIGNFLLQLDDTITLHQSKLEKIHSLKKAYLQKMFI